MDIRIFVDTDSDIRLARRLRRDIQERGRSIASVFEQYNKYVKPAFENYIAPTMTYADIIVPRGNSKSFKKKQNLDSFFGLGGDNEIAIDLIVKHVHRELYKVCVNQFKQYNLFTFCHISSEDVT